MTEEEAFIAALAAEPADRTAALVFADWLDERGDPRGAMLRIDEVRAWMAPKYENPLPKLLAAVETGKGISEASKKLARIGEVAVPGLVALLTHPTPLVRLRAVKALRMMGLKAKAATPALLEMVKGSNKEDVRARREAVGLLGVMKAKQSATDAFSKGLESADDAERLAAVEAMSKLRTKTAAGSLCKALADPAAEVRRAAAGQLRWIAGPTMTFAVEPLRKALSDTDAAVPPLAVVALGKIGPKAAAAVPDLARLLGTTAGKERVGVIEAIGAVGAGTPEALEAILGALRDPGTRQLALGSLGKWPTLPASAAPALLELVRNPNTGNKWGDGQLIQTGLRALGRFNPPPPEVLEELRAQLAKDHAYVAAQAAGEIGPAAASLLPDMVAALDRRRQNWNPSEIATAIGKLGDAGIAALVEVLGRKPPSADHAHHAGLAARALGEAGPAARSAVPALVALLRRKDRFDLAAAVNALAAIGVPADAVPHLVGMLVEGSEAPVGALTDALQAAGPAVLPFAPRLAEVLRQPGRAQDHPQIVEVLAGLVPHGYDALPVLRDALRQATTGEPYESIGYLSHLRRSEVVGAAATGLAALGPAAEEAVPDLAAAYQTFDGWGVREKVLDAYGAIGGKAVPHIRAALAAASRDVRVAAIKALGTTGDDSPESREALGKLETDSNKLVRLRATAAMQKMGTRKAKRK